MDRLNAFSRIEASTAHPRERAWFVRAGLLMASLLAVACGDPSCPAGSRSVDGRCEAAPGCDEGEIEDGGVCTPAPELDGGEPDAGDGDGSVDEIDTGMPDASETPADPLCASLDCGANGICEVVSDAPRCACDPGYTGAHCQTCEAGMVSEGGACVPACEADDAPDCGTHGECEASGGDAECVCQHPHAGATCDECAEGFALQPNGSCEPDCGVCGDHEVCNETLMTPACECVAGYADTGSECEWENGANGGVVDSELNDASAWTTDRVTVEDGAATFNNALVSGGKCHLGAIEQTLRMPGREDAEPLVLEVDARTTCASPDPEQCPPLLVDIGSSLTRLPVAGAASPVTRTLTVCLGDAAFGDDVLLRVRPGLGYNAGGEVFPCTEEWPVLQRIAIRPAQEGECPTDGQLLGSLSGSEGWTLNNGASIATGPSRVAFPSADSRASTLLALPSTGNYAIKYSTDDTSAALSIDGLNLHDRVAGEVTICLPYWAYGSTHRIGFSPEATPSRVTNLRLATDASCAGGELDAGFDRAPETGSWFYSGGFGTSVYIDPSDSPSGSRAWRSETITGAAALLLFPGYGDVTVRPALAAWTQVGAANQGGDVTFYNAYISSPAIGMVNATSVGAGRNVCVEEHWAGQPLLIIAGAIQRLNSGSGSPVMWVDDLGTATVNASVCD